MHAFHVTYWTKMFCLLFHGFQPNIVLLYGCSRQGYHGILECGEGIFTENNAALAPSVASIPTTILQRKTTTNMFEFAGSRKPAESKCYVTHGTMGHLDPKQPPVKRKPYAAILAVPFVHKVRKHRQEKGAC